MKHNRAGLASLDYVLVVWRATLRRGRKSRPNAPGRDRARPSRRRDWRATLRRGLASLDYVLVLGVVLPMVVFIARIGPRIIRAAYEMVCVLLSWPFM